MKDLKVLSVIIDIKQLEVSSHLWHLQTKSYAQHKAFSKLYTELNPLWDSLCESYQGSHNDIIDIDTVEITKLKDHLKALESSTNLLQVTSKHISESSSSLSNIMDEMQSLINTVKYLLTLK